MVLISTVCSDVIGALFFPVSKRMTVDCLLYYIQVNVFNVINDDKLKHLSLCDRISQVNERTSFTNY